MKKNMGNTDRIIRLCIAGILVLLWFQNIITGTWGIVALAVAGVFALTSLVSWCPLYSVFGFKSFKKAS
nr:DUF2892 domain-containing protein [uncultured Lacibacter sp.]